MSEPESLPGKGSAPEESEVDAVAEDPFGTHRPLLFTIAYEMLGSVADAEDVLQDSFIRWSAVDPDTVEYPRAYLVRLVTRQSLNQLRTVKARREDYIGNWLPEPVRTAPDVSEDAILSESLSMAMLLVLETLSPTERAVFVLHDVFGYRHTEIAASVRKSEPTVRQIAHRAREHVHARRRRFEPDTEASRQVVYRFLGAAASGDVQGLMDVLAPDVVQLSDGGGNVVAARKPVFGNAAVANFVLGVIRTAGPDTTMEMATYNGLPAVRFMSGDALDSLVAFEVNGEHITGLYAVRNPEKLGRTETVQRLTRGGSR